MGASRARGAQAKSVVRVVGDSTAVAASAPLDSDYILDSTTRDPKKMAHVLGVDFGSGDRSCTTQFCKITDVVRDLHDNLALVGDAGSELVLLRSCADVCKVVHLLRARGPFLDAAALDSYDQLVKASLQRCLGDLDPFALSQAALGVASGGLGFRSAAKLALPAFVASRVETRWMVETLGSQLQTMGLLTGSFQADFDVVTEEAQAAFLRGLSAVGVEQARSLVEEAAAARRTSEAALQCRPRAHQSAISGDGLILPAGQEDPEFAPGFLQSTLAALQDREACVVLLEELRGAGHLDRYRHLLELRDASVNHDWLWKLSPAHGPVVHPSERQAAVRIRLGASLAPAGSACVQCGAELGACTATHGLLCSRAEATRGHYAVRDVVLELAHLADPSAQAETLGLIPSHPGLRPADILTSAAIPGRLTALDVVVCSPDAIGAADDCCAAACTRKHASYARYSGELQAVYQPLAWSAFGREHLDTTRVLETLAMAAARRRGLQDHRLLLRRTQGAIGVALAVRAVRMAQAVLKPEEVDSALFSEGLGAPEVRNVVLGDIGAEGEGPPADDGPTGPFAASQGEGRGGGGGALGGGGGLGGELGLGEGAGR